MAPSSLCRKTIKMHFCRRWTFLLFGLWSLSLFGQQYYFDHFSVSDGLAQSTVHKIFQDNNDLYWLGTQVGVSSFDGLRFVNYSSNDGLAEGGVRAICQDPSGRIWFGHSEGGISVFDGTDFQKLEAFEEIIGQSTISSILLDKDGQLWFTTAGSGILKLNNPSASPDQYQMEHFSGDEDWINPSSFVSVRKADGYSLAVNWILFPMVRIIGDFTYTDYSDPIRVQVHPDGTVDYVNREKVFTLRLGMDF